MTQHKRIAVHNGRTALVYVQPWLEQRGKDDGDGVIAEPIDRGYLAMARLSNGTTVTGTGDTIEEAVDDVAQRI